MIRAVIFVALVIAASGACAAGSVFRCGSGTYSQTPCPDGKLLDSADRRTSAQRAEASRIAARERKLANEMERARLESVAALPTQPAGFRTSPTASAPSAPGHAKVKKTKPKAKQSADFVALEPVNSARK